MGLLLYQFKCCCGFYGCSCLCVRPVRISISTRAMYSLILIVVSVLMIFAHHDHFKSYLMDNYNQKMNSTCYIINAGEDCRRIFGYISVYRIAFSFSIFHFLMSLFCVCIPNECNWRAKWHNGAWFYKILIIFLIWLTLYFVPLVEKYLFIGTVIGIIASFLFMLFQYISLIDFAYEMNNNLRNSARRNCCYDVLLYVLVVFFYLFSVGGYVIIYIWFAFPLPCFRNRIIILSNAGVTFVLVVLSFCVNQSHLYKLYLPGGIVSIVVTLTTWMGLSSSPKQEVPISYTPLLNSSFQMVQLTDSIKELNCQPKFMQISSTTGRELHVYIAIVVMLFAAVYSSLQTASDYRRYGIKPSNSKIMYKSQSSKQLPTIDEDVEMQDIKSKSKNRISGSHLYSSGDQSTSSIIAKTSSMPSLAMRGTNVSEKCVKVDCKSATNLSAINANSITEMNECRKLPGNKISDYPIDKFLIHDDHFAVQYSYSWLHVTFCLAYLFVMVQLTNWYNPQDSNLLEFQLSVPNMWMKLATGWIALILYGWTLFIPQFCLGRKLYEFPLDSMRRQYNRRKSSVDKEREIKEEDNNLNYVTDAL